tara:strand:- start:281 stop:610 length:330 start_codon:yes stop_codon:yes gene_type:complete
MSKELTAVFHSISNKSIIVKSIPTKYIKVEINGVETFNRVAQPTTYGVWCPSNSEGNRIDPTSLNLQQDQELPGIVISLSSPIPSKDNPKEDSGLFWAGASGEDHSDKM